MCKWTKGWVHKHTSPGSGNGSSWTCSSNWWWKASRYKGHHQNFKAGANVHLLQTLIYCCINQTARKYYVWSEVMSFWGKKKGRKQEFLSSFHVTNSIWYLIVLHSYLRMKILEGTYRRCEKATAALNINSNR